MYFSNIHQRYNQMIVRSLSFREPIISEKSKREVFFFISANPGKYTVLTSASCSCTVSFTENFTEVVHDKSQQ